MLRKSNIGTATTTKGGAYATALSLLSVKSAVSSADRGRGRSLPQPFQMLELRVPGEHLLVEPAIDDAFSKPPLFAELRRRDAVPLCPFVDRLGLEAQITGQLLDRQDFLADVGPIR